MVLYGIIVFYKNILSLFNKSREEHSNKSRFNIRNIISKIVLLLKENLAVTLSAQIVIFPVMILSFGTTSLTFFISNMLAGPIMEVTTIYGFLIVFISFISINLGKLMSIVLNIFLEILMYIAKYTSILPLSKIYVIKPHIIFVILYYILILGYNYIFLNNYIAMYSLQNGIRNKSIKRVLQIRNSIVVKIRKNYKKYILIVLTILMIKHIYNLFPKDLNIYFIDVGQGDSSLIVTPYGKRVLIDGGGSRDMENFDVGESTLIPYLLSRGIKKIDYVMISHFDADHIAGLFTVLEELKVKTVIISRQGENSENYEKFLEIVKRKNIKVSVVKVGDRIKVDKTTYFDILFPEEKQISENILNNNSIVAKLVYRNFSMLFTADIEAIAEKRIVSKYADTNILESTILKVAHHGSKSSSIDEILEKIKPKIAIIGVGETNTFGHPNAGVLQRLENIKCKVYRTDLNGEITIRVNKKRRIWIDKMLN